MASTKIIVVSVCAVVVVGALSYGLLKKSPSATPTPTASAPASSPVVDKTIDIASMAFSPTTITVQAGDTVTWTNDDSVSHTVTSDTGTELDSGNLNQGATYSHVFAAPGTYAYHCAYHSGMVGTVIVQ